MDGKPPKKLLNVVARTTSMRAKTLDKSEITGERLAKDNAEIVFGDMSKYLCFNDAGEPYGDRARCSPEELDLLSEVTVEKTGGKNGIELAPFSTGHLGLNEEA